MSSPTNLPPGALVPPKGVVVFGPNANCTLDICPVEISVYGYRPSLAANASFLVLYVIAAIIHTFLGVRWKQWWFMGCMLASAVSAIIGYAGRIMMYYNPFNFAAFMIQIICVTTVPVYYCAGIYITLALAITHFSPELSHFKPKYFYYILIPSDLFSLVVQAAGGGLSTSSSGQSQLGVNLALVGLAFQVFSILVFCAFFADYLMRYFRSGTWRESQKVRGHSVKWLWVFFGFLVVAVLLTLARCSYRLAELHAGYRDGSSLVRDEGLFIGLEGVMVITAMFCLAVGHPGFVFTPDTKLKIEESNTEDIQELQNLKKVHV